MTLEAQRIRREVWYGRRARTTGGLTKSQLSRDPKTGHISSKRVQAQIKANPKMDANRKRLKAKDPAFIAMLDRARGV